MNRRAFLGSLIGGVAAVAAERTWPFRVYSFPSKHIRTYSFADVEGIITDQWNNYAVDHPFNKVKIYSNLYDVIQDFGQDSEEYRRAEPILYHKHYLQVSHHRDNPDIVSMSPVDFSVDWRK